MSELEPGGLGFEFAETTATQVGPAPGLSAFSSGAGPQGRVVRWVRNGPVGPVGQQAFEVQLVESSHGANTLESGFLSGGKRYMSSVRMI